MKRPSDKKSPAGRLRAMTLAAGLGLLLCGFGGQPQKRKTDQVLPLPPQPPMALRADTNSLDFHLSPLLKSGGLAVQIHRSLSELIRNTRGETIIKLRAFVAGAGDARRVQAAVTQIFSERRLPLPVLSVVQVGGLGEEAAKVVIEAVVSTRRSANPSGLAFFASQIGASLPAATAKLKGAAESARVNSDQVLQVSCFTSRLENYEQSRAQTLALFPKAEINLVQAVRDPQSDESMCEAVGQLSQTPPEGPLVLLKEKRVALVSARQLVFTGLQLSFGSFLDDAHEAFVRLERASTAVDPVEAPVQINVFSIDLTGGSALRKTIGVPPSTLSVATIEGLPSVDATAGIEAVLAPSVAAAASR